MLLLHAPVMMNWVVIGAASPSTRSVWLVKILSILDNLLGSLLASDSTNIAPKTLLNVNLLLFLRTYAAIAVITVFMDMAAAHW